jgi:hypothetical protein
LSRGTACALRRSNAIGRLPMNLEMSDIGSLSDIPAQRQAGRIRRQITRQSAADDSPWPRVSRRPRRPRQPHCRPRERVPARASHAREREADPSCAAFSPTPVPAWARTSGRGGEGDPPFAAGAGVALLDGYRPGLSQPVGRPPRQQATLSVSLITLTAERLPAQ